MLKKLCTLSFIASTAALLTLGGPAATLGVALWESVGTTVIGIVGGITGVLIGSVLSSNNGFQKFCAVLGWGAFASLICSHDIEEYKAKTIEPSVKLSQPAQKTQQGQVIDTKTITVKKPEGKIETTVPAKETVQQDFACTAEKKTVITNQVAANSNTANADKKDIIQSKIIPLSLATP